MNAKTVSDGAREVVIRDLDLFRDRLCVAADLHKLNKEFVEVDAYIDSLEIAYTALRERAERAEADGARWRALLDRLHWIRWENVTTDTSDVGLTTAIDAAMKESK